jgi:hypothetical protein
MFEKYVYVKFTYNFTTGFTANKVNCPNKWKEKPYIIQIDYLQYFYTVVRLIETVAKPIRNARSW